MCQGRFSIRSEIKKGASTRELPLVLYGKKLDTSPSPKIIVLEQPFTHYRIVHPIFYEINLKTSIHLKSLEKVLLHYQIIVVISLRMVVLWPFDPQRPSLSSVKTTNVSVNTDAKEDN